MAHVRRAIKARLLRAVRRNGREYLTMRTCVGFLREAKADLTFSGGNLWKEIGTWSITIP